MAAPKRGPARRITVHAGSPLIKTSLPARLAQPTIADLRANAENGSLGPLLIDVKQAYFGSKGRELPFAACGAYGSNAQTAGFANLGL